MRQLHSIFVLLLLRLRYEGWRAYFKENSNILDFSLVMMSVVDVWIITPLAQGNNLNLKAMTLLRLLRLLRLARLLRLFRIFKELMIIVSGS